MEREFHINITEEPSGSVKLIWDDLWLKVQAVSPLRGEGLCKLWLWGEKGRYLLGTMIPERGRLVLSRRISLKEVRQAGAWPPFGVEAAMVWPFDPSRPFPRTDLFCFAEVKENRLTIRFDTEGQPVMPDV